jgi:hypothetical protein
MSADYRRANVYRRIRDTYGVARESRASGPSRLWHDNKPTHVRRDGLVRGCACRKLNRFGAACSGAVAPGLNLSVSRTQCSGHPAPICLCHEPQCGSSPGIVRGADLRRSVLLRRSRAADCWHHGAVQRELLRVCGFRHVWRLLDGKGTSPPDKTTSLSLAREWPTQYGAPPSAGAHVFPRQVHGEHVRGELSRWQGSFLRQLRRTAKRCGKRGVARRPCSLIEDGAVSVTCAAHRPS